MIRIYDIVNDDPGFIDIWEPCSSCTGGRTHTHGADFDNSCSKCNGAEMRLEATIDAPTISGQQDEIWRAAHSDYRSTEGGQFHPSILLGAALARKLKMEWNGTSILALSELTPNQLRVVYQDKILDKRSRQ